MIRKIGSVAAAWCIGLTVHAAEIVVAQVSPATGPLGPNGDANYIGAKAYFDQVNAQGGVAGQRIRFVREDDQYKPEETLRVMELVAQRDKPVAFVNALGSANVAALLKAGTLDKLAIPVVGVTPGADSLRTPGSRWMFHIQAGDQAQLRRIVTHLSTMGIQRIAVVYQDIPFGTSGLAFVEKTAGTTQLKVVGKVPVKPGEDNLGAAADAMKQSGAQAYVVILAPNSGVAFARDVRSRSDPTPLYGLSYVPVKGLVDKVPNGGYAGIGLAQVTPNVYSNSTALMREFHTAMDKHAPGGTDHSQLHLIGYMAARVTVEGLRRAGPGPTPERLAAALRQLRTDLGGYQMDFTGENANVGSLYVDIGVVTREGRLMY